MTAVENNLRARILIADDEPQIREMLHVLLGQDYECREVSSAEEALVLLRAEKFELVLSDIMMSGLSGLEMVPHVLEIAPDTVVIMISGEQNIQSAIHAMQVGAFDYITKPFTLQHVEAAIRRALEHQALRASKRYYENFLEEIVRQRTTELNKSNQTLRTLIQAAPLAIFSLDAEGQVKMWNPAAERLFGWNEEEVLNRQLPILSEEMESTLWLKAALQDETINELETHCRKKGGTLIDVNIWTAALSNTEGETEGTMVVVADITERKQAEERINYLAYHDTLTGLPNRALFEDCLAQSLHLARRYDQKLAVMFTALDRFKKYNDTLGHTVSDQLLRAVTKRLLRVVREGDMVARFEGDEFSLLLTSINSAEDAAAMASHLQQALKPPFHIDGHELYATVSIGTGLYPDDGTDTQTLLMNAGAALYYAKQQSGDNYQFYTADINERALKHLSLENSLRRALDNEEFLLHYQ